MSEIKKCPFCGGDASYEYHAERMYPSWIGCDNFECLGSVDGAFENYEEALKAWNKRPIEQEFVEQIRRQAKTIAQLSKKNLE